MGEPRIGQKAEARLGRRRGVRVARRSEREAAAGRPKAAEPGPGLFTGLALIGKSRYLGLIALYVFVYAVTSTVLYLEQARLMKETYTDRAAQTAAFANLDMYKQAATLVCQVFLTSTIVRSAMAGALAGTLPTLRADRAVDARRKAIVKAVPFPTSLSTAIAPPS